MTGIPQDTPDGPPVVSTFKDTLKDVAGRGLQVRASSLWHSEQSVSEWWWHGTHQRGCPGAPSCWAGAGVVWETRSSSFALIKAAAHISQWYLGESSHKRL